MGGCKTSEVTDNKMYHTGTHGSVSEKRKRDKKEVNKVTSW